MAIELPGLGQPKIGNVVTEPAELEPSLEVVPKVTDALDRKGAKFDSGARDKKLVSKTSIGRNGLRPTSRDVTIGGHTFSPIAAKFEKLDPAQQLVANSLGDLFSNRDMFHASKLDDHRNVGAVDVAMKLPYRPGAQRALRLFKVGLGNTAPGPAQMTLLARHSDRLVLMNGNSENPSDLVPRPVTEVDGIPLPKSLLGKVFEVGSRKNTMITYRQASDLTIQQLGAMEKAGFFPDGIANANADVIAHSQGSLDMALTRERLQAAGLDHVFAELTAMAPPFRGSPVSANHMAGLLAAGGKALGLQVAAAIRALAPQHVKEDFGPHNENLVDRTIIGHTDIGKKRDRNLHPMFDVVEDVVEAAQAIPAFFAADADVRENDGLVTIDSQEFGREQIKLGVAHDHATIANDPMVIDEILRRQDAAAG